MTVVYDIETFSNFFSYCDYNVTTKETKIFIISSWKNQHQELKEHLRSIKKSKGGMIGFNNLYFDWPITYWIWNQETITAEKIYAYTQKLVSEDKRTYAKEEIKQLDLYLLNHYDNKARSTSLKALEVSLGWDNVMDIPYHHSRKVNRSEEDYIIEYNLNDVLFTAKFYEVCKNKIDIRKKIKSKYNLNVINKSDVVIGESIFIKYLSEAMDVSPKDLREVRGQKRNVPLKDIIFDYVKFRDPKLIKLLGLMRETVSSPQYLKEFVQNVNMNKSTNELLDMFNDNNIVLRKLAQQKKSFSFKINYAGIPIDYGVGGVHGCISPGVYKSSKTYKILDIDVKSYYPNLFIQNRLHPRQMDQDTFVKVYHDIFQQRVRAQLDGDKLTSDALKLALNGLFGKTGSDVSCFYDPYVFYAVTVNGQLLITMLMESVVGAGAEILQVNTDGLTVSAPQEKWEQIIEVCEKWEQKTKLTLEYNEYSQMIIRDVNNYIAVGVDGKVKEKGAFETSKDWHKDNSYMIVPMAVKEYFVNGTPIEQTIDNHKNILDFCGRYKASPGWSVEYVYLEKDKERRINYGKIYRFIPVVKGGRSMKVNKDGREHHLCESSMTYPFNVIEDFDFKNINYEFFYKECQKLIQTIQPLQMNLL